MKKTNKGFTLVELLVVIAIIAILSTVAVIGYTSFLTKAKESNAQAEARQIDIAIEAVLMNNDGARITDSVWVKKTVSGYEAVTSAPSGNVEDLRSNFEGLSISNSGNILLYTGKDGIKVNVDTNAIIK